MSVKVIASQRWDVLLRQCSRSCNNCRAVARILFQPRQRGKPRVWGRSSQWGPGPERLLRASGDEALLKVKGFQ